MELFTEMDMHTVATAARSLQGREAAEAMFDHAMWICTSFDKRMTTEQFVSLMVWMVMDMGHGVAEYLSGRQADVEGLVDA